MPTTDTPPVIVISLTLDVDFILSVSKKKYRYGVLLHQYRYVINVSIVTVRPVRMKKGHTTRKEARQEDFFVLVSLPVS